MTRSDLIELHKGLTEHDISILEAKNQDYAHGNDPFANFRASEAMGVPGEIDILMRCIDKFKRIQAFVERGDLKVQNEPVDDAILDVINYMILLQGMIMDRAHE